MGLCYDGSYSGTSEDGEQTFTFVSTNGPCPFSPLDPLSGLEFRISNYVYHRPQIDPGGGGGGSGRAQPALDPVVSNQKPTAPPCQTKDPFTGALELTIKVGPEVQAGPLKAGASWYSNITTGDMGAKLEGNLGLVGGSIDAPKGPLGFGGGPQNNKNSVSLFGFNYDSSTGQWKFSPTKSLSFGAQLLVGFDLSFNSETFKQIANQNAGCIAKAGGG